MENSPTYTGSPILRHARISVGYSLDRLAAEVGCSRSKLHRIESGHGYSDLTEDLAERLAAAVNMSVEALFGMGPGGTS